VPAAGFSRSASYQKQREVHEFEQIMVLMNEKYLGCPFRIPLGWVVK
jgi:adenylate cyclase class IV